MLQVTIDDCDTVRSTTDNTDSRCFSFFSGMSVLTLALCARLSWLLVSF